MKVLVTGGAGFVGSHIVNKLIDNNIETYVLVSGFRSNKHPCTINKDASIVKGDLTKYDTLLNATKDIDIVLHVGGIFSHYVDKYPELAIDVNIKGTWNLKKASSINNVNHIIYASSSFVYGDVENIPLHENSLTEPKDLLGITKLAGEKILKLTYLDKIDYTILRLFNVYGEYQYPDELYTSVLSTWIKQSLEKKDLVIHDDGTQSLDFVYVKDVAEAFILSINNSASRNEIFNVGSGRSITMNELARLVNKITKNERPPIYNPNHPMFLKSIQADIKKIEIMLGWKSKIRIEEGLKNMIEEMKTRRN